MNKKILVVMAFLGLASCAPTKNGIYSGLSENEDGIIDTVIGDDDSDGLFDLEAYSDWLNEMEADQLTAEEAKLIDYWLHNERERISFLIVDSETGAIERSYAADHYRILASVTKLSTAVAALENVRNVTVSKVQAMLKSSNNGEASRYVRLAAKALIGMDTPGDPWTGHSSCPPEAKLAQERPAAAAVFEWVRTHIEGYWDGADLRDGAGCHYSNLMTATQVASLLRYADKRGAAYGGMKFEQLLSISGVDGTWKSRNTDARGRILAKTGTLSTASNLSGYFYAKQSNRLRKYYFSVFIHKSGSQAPGETRTLTERLMRYWLQYYAAKTDTPPDTEPSPEPKL